MIQLFRRRRKKQHDPDILRENQGESTGTVTSAAETVPRKRNVKSLRQWLRGNVAQVIENTVDATERKRSETILHRCEHIVSTTSDMMALLDTNYTYLVANVAYVRAFQLTKDQIIGKTVPEVFGSQFFHEVIKSHADRCMAGGEVTYQQWFDFPAYPPRFMEIHYYPYKDKTGTIKGFVVNGRDITRRKRAEDELSRYKAHLEESVRKRTCQLQEANQRLQEEITERQQGEGKLIEYQESLRSMSSELSMVEEQERRRIAESLHDSVAQTLVSCKLDIDRAKAGLAQSDTVSMLSEVSRSLQRTIREIRTLMFDLSSPTLYELGLEPAIEELLGKLFSVPPGFQVEFTSDGQPKPLADEVKIMLYRSVRELLVNVIKHAHASAVSVCTQRIGDEIHIALVDNGIGFEPSLADRAVYCEHGYGLFSIRERLGHYGGEMHIESHRGQGARIAMRCPLDVANCPKP